MIKKITFRTVFLRPMAILSFLVLAGCNPVDGLITMGTSKILGSKSISSKLNKPVITTDFSDAQQEKVLDNAFGNDQVFKPLSRMPRSHTGGYLLTPGFYEMVNKSYCIKAGTHGPSQGDGYLWAPLRGKARELMLSIVRNSEHEPLIMQQQVQVLLWAILAKAKFSDLPADLKAVSAKLLTPAQLLELNGGAMSLVPDAVVASSIASLPRPVQLVIEAENKMRAILYNAQTTYAELESIAVLMGAAIVDRPDIVKGQWSKHSSGYYVRYFPQGYTRTKVQVYVPKSVQVTSHQGFYSSPFEMHYQPVSNYDAPNDVAVPANRGAQRLLQSNENGGGIPRIPGLPIELPPEQPDPEPEPEKKCPWSPLPGDTKTDLKQTNFKDCQAFRSFIKNGKSRDSVAWAYYKYKGVAGKEVYKKVGKGWKVRADVRFEPRFNIEIKAPGFDSISEGNCEEVHNYMDDLLAHEQGHIDMYKKTLKKFNKNTRYTGQGASKEEAYTALRNSLLSKQRKLDNELKKEKQAYDKTTDHGWHQDSGPAQGYPEGGGNLELPSCTK